MQEIPDNELDNLFRKSLSSSNIPFDEKAWNSMEKKLEDEERRRAFYWRISGGIASLLLLGTLSIISFNNNFDTEDQAVVVSSNSYRDDNEEKKQNNISTLTKDNGKLYNNKTIKEVPDNTIVKVNNVLFKKSNNLSNSDLNDKNGDLDKITANKSAYLTSKVSTPKLIKDKNITNSLSIVSNSNTTHVDKVNNNSANSISEKSRESYTNNSNTTDINNDLSNSNINNNIIEKSKEASIDNTASINGNKEGSSTNSTIAKNEKTEATAITTLNQSSSVESGTTGIKTESISDSNATYAMDSAVKPPLAIVDKKDTSAITKRRTHYISLNFILNPEFSTSPSMSFYKPGFNTGLIVEYYLCDRISILAGGLYSKKLYTAEGYEYKSENKSWKDPSSVKGGCNVIETPISIRYKFIRKSTYNIYVTSGLLSYIMLKENYTYLYNATATSKAWSSSEKIVNQNRYFFSIYTTSIGIEKYLNQN